MPKITGCQLIENAKNNPNWDDSMNAKLCNGECEKCPHAIKEVNKLSRRKNKEV